MPRISFTTHDADMEAKRVQVWVGYFNTQQRCKDFFKFNRPWDGKRPITEFAKSQEKIQYFTDHLYCYYDDVAKLEEFFWRGLNIDANVIPSLVKDIQNNELEVNCVVIYSVPDITFIKDFQDEEAESYRLNRIIDFPRSIISDDHKLYYLGEFPAANNLLWEDHERSHQWVGYFQTEERFKKFMEEVYSEDEDVPLSEFAASQGTTWYDHDWLGSCYEPNKTVDNYFKGSKWEYGEGEAERLLTLAKNSNLERINSYITFFECSAKVREEGCPGPQSYKGGDYELIYLGRYKPHSDLLT